MTLTGAFDEAVKSTLPFDTIIYTASPFFFNAVKDYPEFLNPTLLGTMEILGAVRALAPEVRRVIIAGSFAALIDKSIPPNVSKMYKEEDWNPGAWEGALVADKGVAHRASRKFAEKAVMRQFMLSRDNYLEVPHVDRGRITSVGFSQG
jgi:hypothetical protein